VIKRSRTIIAHHDITTPEAMNTEAGARERRRPSSSPCDAKKNYGITALERDGQGKRKQRKMRRTKTENQN
jgi:hypothetical protein